MGPGSGSDKSVVLAGCNTVSVLVVKGVVVVVDFVVVVVLVGVDWIEELLS